MNEIQTFTNAEFGSLRTVEIDGMIWFVGKDVAKALGYKNPQEAVRMHVDPEDKGVSKTLTPRGEQDTTIINESGLYSLILSSKLPKAKEFKHWVTSEVLPSIRKTGQYTLIDKPTAETVMDVQMRPLTPDDYISAARIIANCKRDRLPIVLGMLCKGGWDIGGAIAIAEAAKTTTADLGTVLRLFTDAGGKLSRISALTGIDASTLRHYRLDHHTPSRERYEAVISAIAAEALGTNGQNQNQL